MTTPHTNREDIKSDLFTGPAAAYAAIDLGTNNCRMLVARPFKESFRVIDSFSRIVRLGEGVAAEGRLSENAIKRTVSARKVCHAKMMACGVQRIRSVATEACRRAENAEEFLGRASKKKPASNSKPSPPKKKPN